MGEETLREGSRGAVHKVSRIVSKREVVRNPAVSVVKTVARRFGMGND